MARKRLSESVLTSWLSQFRKHPAPETSPEIVEVARARRIAEAPPEPSPPPPRIIRYGNETEVRRGPPPVVRPPAPEPSPGPVPRMILIQDGELWERMPNGSIWPAAEGAESKDPAVAWRKAREKEINFT